MSRVVALVTKELIDLRQNPMVFLPALLTGVAAVAYPFLIAIVIPSLAGERLSDSSDFRVALELYQTQPGTRQLDPEGAIQAWIFQQCLVLVVALTPVAGSMSIAAHSVIGEKQARTLEPLLATPITTPELLAAKVLGAALPGFALTMLCFGVYIAGVAVFGRPQVWTVLFLPRSLATVFLLAPLAALVALQLAVCTSSRVNDVRSAQQIGALIVLPLAGLMIAQLMGAVMLTLPVILGIALLLGGVNVVLLRVAIALFDRESILTRWR